MTAGAEALLDYRLRCVRIGVQTTVLAVAVLGAYPLLPGHGVERPDAYAALLLAAFGGMVVVWQLPWIWLFDRGLGVPALYAWSVLDIVLISIGVVLSGGGGSEWVLVYALTTVFFAASYPVWGQVALLTFTGLAYCTALAVSGWDITAADLLFRLGLLVCVEFMAGFLAQRLMAEMSRHLEARRESEERAALLALVADGARGMSTVEPEQLLRTVVEYATRIGFDGAEICMFDEQSGIWMQEYQHGIAAMGYEAWAPLDAGLAGEVRRTRCTTVVEDYQTFAGALMPIRDAGYRTMVATPVWCGEELAGVLIAGALARRPVRPQEIEAVELLGSQAGAALLVTRRYAERQAHEVMLHHQATHDPLTGLPNRTLLFDRISHALASCRRNGGEVAVLFVDLDRFKNVNDSLGHDAGDQLLREVSERLQASVRPGDTLARYGGDEFVVVLERDEAAAAVAVAERMRAVLRAPIHVAGRQVVVSASIGIARSQGDHGGGDHDAVALLREADLAMFHAKQHGRDRWRAFAAEMGEEAALRLDRETALRRALAGGEFVLHYQPLISLHSGQIDSVEALVRWQHPERGLIGPDQFIALAESTGMIVPLGRWVLGEACRQVRRWADAGLDLSVAVNLSAAQFQQVGLVGDVADAISAAGIPPTRLTLEVTESVMVGDLEGAISTMDAIQRLGVSIALDDFGEGYAFLGHLKRFPVRVVKIDRSFVEGVVASRDDQAIVRAVVGLSHDLNMTVVAEGVETAEQFHEVRRLGCDRVQGYLVSRPGPAEDVTALLLAPPQLPVITR